MWSKLLRSVWRSVPKRWRRWGVILTEARFTVTAGAVVTDAEGRVLLLQHAFRPGSGWGIPGGFMTKAEQPEAAIRRELREEIGLEVESLELAFVRTLTAVNQVEVIFRCRPRGEVRPQSSEVSRAEWFAPNQWPAGLSRDQQRVIERALSTGAPPEHKPAVERQS